MDNVFYLQYFHENREFRPAENVAELKALDMENIDDFMKTLSSMGIDGLLILDKERGKWFLVFGSHVGLIAQRTARRQADTIVRSGYLKPDGERIQARYPLEELSQDNIGDLWKTVQEKYMPNVDLRGMVRGEE